MTDKKSHFIFFVAVFFVLSVGLGTIFHQERNEVIETEELTKQFLNSNPPPVQVLFIANKMINPTPYSMLSLLDKEINKKIEELLKVTKEDKEILINTLKTELKKENLSWVSTNKLLETLIKLNKNNKTRGD